jgi:hypothetical protein
LKVSVDEFPAVTEAGLKFAETPAGSPLMLSETVCADPLVTAVEIVELPLPPCGAFAFVALIEKSDGGGVVTVTVTVAVCVAPVAPAPVTVIV